MTDFERYFADKEFDWKLGLDRVREAIEAAGGKQFPSIIVAGTNGKGSTSLFAAESLYRNGLKVGLFSSPHVFSFNERIKINMACMPDELLDSCFRNVLPLIKRYKLTYFESSLLLALEVFKSEQVDCAVFEVGLGGRLDATNALEHQVAVITPVGFDHREFLGNTLSEIAMEKAGVIKEGMSVVVSENSKEVVRTIFKKPAQEFYLYGSDFWVDGVGLSLSGTSFYYMATVPVTLSMVGEFQAVNASAGIKAAQLLCENFLGRRFLIPRELTSTLPGRFQILRREPVVVFDGAHNNQALSSLFETALKLGIKGSVVYAGFKDKEQLENLKKVSEYLKITKGKLFIFELPFGRTLDAKELVEFAKGAGIKDVEIIERIKLSEFDFPLIVTGSFYLGGFIETGAV